MIPLALEDVARLCPGRLQRAEGIEHITGVTIDSRRVVPGDLFVAVSAGARYLDAARRAGAAATLVPDDALAALAALGSAIRERTQARIAAITGSAGKTSTKDILAAICRPHARVVAAEASYNNELGVPLTLCRIEEDTEICILELAMRGLGQIAELAGIARPHVGVITNVGPAHVELVGSVEAVARAKGELVDALPPGGTAVVPETFEVGRTDIHVLRVGEVNSRIVEGRTTLEFAGRDISFNLRARHQAQNALAALHAARALGVEADNVVDVELSRWRGEEVELAGGGILVNDCYNANPLSMRAALDHLVDCAEGRRTVAVLGEMAELGQDAPQYHREVGRHVAELGVDVVVAVGPLARGYLVPGREGREEIWAETALEAAEIAARILEPGDCVLVKASRAIGLEVVADVLTSGAI